MWPDRVIPFAVEFVRGEFDSPLVGLVVEARFDGESDLGGGRGDEGVCSDGLRGF